MKRDFLTNANRTRAGLPALPDRAALSDELAGCSVTLGLMNPPRRTLTSFETGVCQLGRYAAGLPPCRNARAVEFESGAVMDGDAEENLAEQASALPLHEERLRATMALTPNALFSRCRPLRRNVKAADEVVECPACVAVEEAAHRLPVQKAVMSTLIATRRIAS